MAGLQYTNHPKEILEKSPASQDEEGEFAVPSAPAQRDVDDDEVYSLREQKRIIRHMYVTLPCLE